MLTAIKECKSEEWGGGNCADYYYYGLDKERYWLEGIEGINLLSILGRNMQRNCKESPSRICRKLSKIKRR